MRDQMFWHEMNNHEIPQESKLIWKKMKRHQISWDKMTWAAKNWDEVKKLRRHEMSWDEMGWHRLRWQWDEIRWNEKRFNIRKAWHQIDKSRACCHEAQEACLSPIGTAFALKLLPPACPGTTCKEIGSLGKLSFWSFKMIGAIKIQQL